MVGQQQQHQAAMRPPAAQPQAHVRAPPPVRQDPYQGKGVSVRTSTGRALLLLLVGLLYKICQFRR